MRALANYPMKVHRIAIFIFVPDFDPFIADEALLMRTVARRIESPPAGRYLEDVSEVLPWSLSQRNRSRYQTRLAMWAIDDVRSPHGNASSFAI